MIPRVAVVCAAHTQLGRQVLQILLRSTNIRHVYGLSEMDIRDNLSLSPHHQLKLTLLVRPLDYLERTVSSSIPEVDLAFHCLCTPRHVVPTLGAYLFHKLNFDIPLRFLHEMAQLSAHSVAIISHPSASPTSRSHYLRVKGELVKSAERIVETLFPNSPRLAVFNVPALMADPRRPLEDHEIDHMHNGIRPASLSPMDRIKQRVALKHDPDSVRPLRVRDIASAMVADAIDSIDNVNRDEISQLRHWGCLIENIDPTRIVQLASTARTLRTVRSTVRRDRATMKDKVSSYARQQTNAFRSVSTPDSSDQLRTDVNADQYFSPRVQYTHSVHALGEQSKRTLTRVLGNDMLPDATSRGERQTAAIHQTSHRKNSQRTIHRSSSDATLSRSNSYDYQTPLAGPQTQFPLRGPSCSPPLQRNGRRKSVVVSNDNNAEGLPKQMSRSFHSGAVDLVDGVDRGKRRQSRRFNFDRSHEDEDWVEGTHDSHNRRYTERNRRSGRVAFGEHLSSIVGRVMAAVERPSIRKERIRERNVGY